MNAINLSLEFKDAKAKKSKTKKTPEAENGIDVTEEDAEDSMDDE